MERREGDGDCGLVVETVETTTCGGDWNSTVIGEKVKFVFNNYLNI